MSIDKCDQEVFDRGELVGIFAMTKEQAEAYCTQESQKTGCKYDWHFAAGRVVIKALPPQPEYSI